MKSRLSIAIFLLLMHLCSWAQIGGDYNPDSPSDPPAPTLKYNLSITATPENSGSFNVSSEQLAAGSTNSLYAYANTDFVFKHWMIGDSILSTNRNIRFVMPLHDVKMVGVFEYKPGSPADPPTPTLKYNLSITATPENSGSFNVSNEQLAAGGTNSLYAYTSSDFVFKHWMIGDSVLSTSQNISFVMPSHDVKMVGVFEYNPTSPANPNRNYWNAQTGEAIIDDFTAGYLSSALSSAISGSSSSDVQTIVVSGKITSNDFGIANNYTNCFLLDLSRVTGVTEVPSYAFDYTSLESVYLPATIEKIGTRAFAECTKLSSLTIYAMTPPTLGSNVFYNVPEGLVVYVPASAVSQYQDDDNWGKFTILPIQEDIRSISVSLPDGANGADYEKMWLELTNIKNGQRMHYVMTDHTLYTFRNIIRNTSWNVILRNEQGNVFGRIDSVEVKDEDVSVKFASLSRPQTVSLSVTTPEGTDVTSQTQITWTDSKGNYLAQGTSLSGLPTGYQTTYRVTLSQELAMTYNEPQSIDYALKDDNNNISCRLGSIRQVSITGKMKDASTGNALSGAVVSASQTFGGQYNKTVSTKTDANGAYTLNVPNVSTSMIFAASGHISQTINCDSLLNNETTSLTMNDVSLKEITGATISLDFSYTTCDGETQDYYNDYLNVSYELFNTTQSKAVSQYNVQYPKIVLLEDVADGDVLKIIATSRTNAFMPITTTVTIKEQKADAALPIVELGQIQSKFTSTYNASVVGSLYDANGKLLKTYDYTDTSLTISNLADGQYTLVSMGSSQLFNTIYDLAQLPQSGLAEGSDYVQNNVEVKSGTVVTINIDKVPTLDESKLYYTGENTSFTVNKPSIVAGNYLTLTGRVDFKSAYASDVSNVQMIVDLPESCEFVDNSVMVGNSTSSYTLNDNQLIIPMARYTDRVRFCVIPTASGEYAPTAYAYFALNGQMVMQPIGSANYDVKNLSITVPSTIAKPRITVSGTAMGKSSVTVYDNDGVLATTEAQANGSWTITADVPNTTNLSRHDIYAKIVTPHGLEIITDTKQCQYDICTVRLKTIGMSFYNGYYKRTVECVWDFENLKSSVGSYEFFKTTPFTFVADFTNNDTTKVSDVSIIVYTGDGKKTVLPASYNAKSDKWVASESFSSSNLPVNVDATYTSLADDVVLSGEMMTDAYACFNDVVSQLKEDNDEYAAIRKKIDDALAKDDIYWGEVESLYDEYHKILGITIDISDDVELLSEDEHNRMYEQYKAQQETYSTYNADSLINAVLSQVEGASIDDASGQNYKITVSTCEGYTEEMLGADLDFVSFNTTDGKCLYVKATEQGLVIVDFNNDICYNLQEVASESANAASKASAENFVNRLKNGVNWITDRIDQIREITNNILGVINDVEEHLENGHKSIQKSYGEAYIQLQKLNRMKNQGKYVAPGRIFVLELTCEGYETELKGLQQLKKGVANLNSKFYGKVFGAMGLLSSFIECRNDLQSFINLYYSVPNPCKDDETKASEIKRNIGFTGIAAFTYYTSTITADVASLLGIGPSVASAPATAGSSLMVALAAIGKLALSYGINAAYRYGTDVFKKRASAEIKRLKCNKDDDAHDDKPGFEPYVNDQNTDDGNDDTPPIYPPVAPILDPSGYVYEAIPSNRLEGVTATAYYKETVEDMYGDLHENIVKWNAEEYAQKNPLFTDGNGMYAWDVPQGLWQMKFEKAGYETTTSEWLPVPPPQLDINIAMKQNVQPEVKAARAYGDAVEMEFSKYMMPELLNAENITVAADGKIVEGTVELLNEEVSYEGATEKYASKVRFNAAAPFEADEVTLRVNNRVKSYAGIRMQDNYEQTFTVEQEIKQIAVDSLTTVGYGESSTLVVRVLPASASKGKVLSVNTTSPTILGIDIDEVTIDDSGKAEITLTGYLPGTAALTFSVDGTDKSNQTIVSVENRAARTVATPQTSIASGTSVGKGTAITLSCTTDGATIYYTLDGSCPCDNISGRLVYDGTPIIINESVTIKAMAVASGKYDSDVVEFSYTVDATGIDEVTMNALIEIFPLPVHDKLNVTVGGKTINSVAVSSISGTIIAKSTNAATTVTLDVSQISAGIYIINVATENGLYSRKIVKVQ